MAGNENLGPYWTLLTPEQTHRIPAIPRGTRVRFLRVRVNGRLRTYCLRLPRDAISLESQRDAHRTGNTEQPRTSVEVKNEPHMCQCCARASASGEGHSSEYDSDEISAQNLRDNMLAAEMKFMRDAALARGDQYKIASCLQIRESPRQVRSPMESVRQNTQDP